MAVEQYDDEGCLKLDLRPTMQHTKTCSSTQNPEKVYFTQICNGRGQYGCSVGCINCKDKFICNECKEGWEVCQCHDRGLAFTSQPVQQTSALEERFEQILLSLEQNYQTRFSSLQQELDKERELRKEWQAKASGDRSTSPTSLGSRRRRRSRDRPWRKGDPLEAIDQDATHVDPDWKAIADVVSKYSSETSGDKATLHDSAFLAEEVGPQQADEKWEERRKLSQTSHAPFRLPSCGSIPGGV
jgi:hypothetical protein